MIPPCRICKDWLDNKHRMCQIATDECVCPPDNFDLEEANRAFYRSRFGAPNQIKRFSHALSSCFLESSHHDLSEITIAYDNSQGETDRKHMDGQTDRQTKETAYSSALH